MKFRGNRIEVKVFAGTFVWPRSPVATRALVSESKIWARRCLNVMGTKVDPVSSCRDVKAGKEKFAGAAEN